MSIEDQISDFLLPGHVWTHTKKGTSATILFVTNTHLDEKFLRTYPQHVVYLDASGNLTSATIEQFTKTRGFTNVDPTVEGAIDTLVSTVNEEEDLDLSDDAQGSEPAAAREQEEIQRAIDETPASIDLQLEASTTDALPVVSAELLQGAICGYRSQPNAKGDVLHEVVFALSEELDNEKLYTAFSSPLVRYSAMTVAGIPVSWDKFLGVHPNVLEHGEVQGIAVFLEEAEEEQKPAPNTSTKPATKPAAKTATKAAAKTAAPKPEESAATTNNSETPPQETAAQ